MSHVDITVGGRNAEGGEKPAPKRFLGVKFACAYGMYSRLYCNNDGTAYEGRCPECLKLVKIRIGEGGTDSRFFSYDCNRR